MDSNKNVNCLEGLECPNCGNHDSLLIAALAWFVVTDDGAECKSDVEWDKDADCKCEKCDYHAKVRDFDLIEIRIVKVFSEAWSEPRLQQIRDGKVSTMTLVRMVVETLNNTFPNLNRDYPQEYMNMFVGMTRNRLKDCVVFRKETGVRYHATPILDGYFFVLKDGDEPVDGFPVGPGMLVDLYEERPDG
jgi:hypothetical protein